ncbi:MAG: TolC family protein [Panacagrimonas sp.]
MIHRRARARLAAGLLLTCSSSPCLAYDLDPFETRHGVSATPEVSLLQTEIRAEAGCEFAAVDGPLALLEAVERALCNSPETRRAWASAKAQAAEVGVATAAYLPTLSATLGYAQQHNRVQVNDRLRDIDPGLAAALTSDAHPTVRNASLKASLVLLDFGLRGANLDQAQALLEAANATHDASMQAVLFNTAEAYFSAMTGHAVALAKSEIEAAAERSHAAAEAKHKAGVGTLIDKLQAKTAYLQSKLERVKAGVDEKNAVDTLAALMGTGVGMPLVLAQRGDSVPDIAFVESVDRMIEQARQQHPGLRAAQAELEAANAKIASAEAEGRPRLAFGADLSSSDQLGQPPTPGLPSIDSYYRNSNVALQLSFPLFDGFKSTYRTRSAVGQSEAKAAALALAEQKIALDVSKSYRAFGSGMQTLEVTAELLDSARQSFDIAQGRYRDGVGGILELLNAQTALSRASQLRIESLSSFQTARLKLAASVGKLGLWAVRP